MSIISSCRTPIITIKFIKWILHHFETFLKEALTQDSLSWILESFTRATFVTIIFLNKDVISDQRYFEHWWYCSTIILRYCPERHFRYFPEITVVCTSLKPTPPTTAQTTKYSATIAVIVSKMFLCAQFVAKLCDLILEGT